MIVDYKYKEIRILVYLLDKLNIKWSDNGNKILVSDLMKLLYIGDKLVINDKIASTITEEALGSSSNSYEFTNVNKLIESEKSVVLINDINYDLLDEIKLLDDKLSNYRTIKCRTFTGLSLVKVQILLTRLLLFTLKRRLTNE